MTPLIKLTEENRFVTSDPHFGHDKPWIVGERGAPNVRAHDQRIVEDWNAVIPPDGEVWLLGDMAAGGGDGNTQAAYLKHLLSLLNGHIILIWGNHNAGAKQLYEEAWQEAFPGKTRGADQLHTYPLTWNNKLTFAGFQQIAKIRGRVVVFTHYPQEDWFERKKGSFNVHGHCHKNRPASQPETFPSQHLDAGVDNFKAPMPFKSMIDMLKERAPAKVPRNQNPAIRRGEA